MPQLHIITASTRPGRVGPHVSAWVEGIAQRSSEWHAQVVDLQDYDLPVFNEAKHPRLGQYAHAATQRWSATVAQADALVMVFPEYNHFPAASLINAITYLSKEWQYKPVGLVSYGGLSGGVRAAQAIKPMLSALKMVPMVESVAIPLIAEKVQSGALQSSEALDEAATQMLRELARWAGALKTLR